jgi:N-formylglutamate amidohydrolase
MGHCEPYPEICLGYDDSAVAPGLIEEIAALFKTTCYSVGDNHPYQGALVPIEFEGNPDFFALMIEVNKSVYLDGANAVISDRFTKLQGVMNQIVDAIRKWPVGGPSSRTS